jgi:hypothetical protein
MKSTSAMPAVLASLSISGLRENKKLEEAARVVLKHLGELNWSKILKELWRM